MTAPDARLRTLEAGCKTLPQNVPFASYSAPQKYIYQICEKKRAEIRAFEANPAGKRAQQEVQAAIADRNARLSGSSPMQNAQPIESKPSDEQPTAPPQNQNSPPVAAIGSDRNKSGGNQGQGPVATANGQKMGGVRPEFRPLALKALGLLQEASDELLKVDLKRIEIGEKTGNLPEAAPYLGPFKRKLTAARDYLGNVIRGAETPLELVISSDLDVMELLYDAKSQADSTEPIHKLSARRLLQCEVELRANLGMTLNDLAQQRASERTCHDKTYWGMTF
jgi:hypothetical protein